MGSSKTFEELIKTHRMLEIIVASLLAVTIIGGSFAYGMEVRLNRERDKAVAAIAKDLKAAELPVKLEMQTLEDCQEAFDEAKSREILKRKVKKVKDIITAEKAEATKGEVDTTKVEIKKASVSTGGAAAYKHDYNVLKQIAIQAARQNGGIHAPDKVESSAEATTVDSSVAPTGAKTKMNKLGEGVKEYKATTGGAIYFDIKMVPSGNGYEYSFVYGY